MTDKICNTGIVIALVTKRVYLKLQIGTEFLDHGIYFAQKSQFNSMVVACSQCFEKGK
jgi:hypothetical protein